MKKFLFLCLLTVSVAGWAQTERGVLIREAQLYISPDDHSQKLSTVPRGREVAVMDKTRDYIKVLANVEQGRDITGWIVDKGVVRAGMPNGDRVLFGEAAESELEASRRGGRKGADKDALRLYYRTYEYFPKSDLAGEALWRAADIQWQLQKEDVMGRRSSREMEPYLRGKMEEDLMDEVRKKFAGTKWAALASFAKIDNKICGEWKGLPKCPEKESEMFEEYAKNHPDSPKAAEALFEAATRQAALIEIYKANDDRGKSEQARARAIALGKRILAEYPQQGDFPARSHALVFKLEQGIPTYGAAKE